MIGVSACLGGLCCRYDGRHQAVFELKELLAQKEAISVCPEVLGGLPIPRDPAEIVNGNGFDVWEGTAQVMTNQGEDVTELFKAGAKRAYRKLQEKGIQQLVLKDKSPSCGSQWIYDGTFSGTLKQEVGVATAYFLLQGMDVQSESQWLKAQGGR